MMHMVDQIKQLGPVYLHQMWTYERFMSTLNRYVHNCAYREGSMIKAYTTKESINWCMRYIKDARAIVLPVHQHEGRTARIGCTGQKVCTDIPNKEVEQAHYSILHRLVSMDKYVEKHLKEICTAHDENERRHGSRKSTRSISWNGSKSNKYHLIRIWRPLRSLREAPPAKSPRGKGMT
jgi:hypothetical protein